MNSKKILGFVLASSLALTTLAGCNVPGAAGPAGGNTVQQPGGQMSNGGQTAPAPARAEARDGAAEALAEEREMGDMDAMAADSTAAGYAVFALGGPKPRDGEVAITTVDASGETEVESETETRDGKVKTRIKAKIKADVRAKIEERQMKRAQKAAERLKGNADKVKNAAKNAKWVDNGDGTESKSFSSDVSKTVNGKTMTRKVEIKRTRDIESKDLIESYVKLETTLPNGMSRKSERSKKLNGEDGSYTVTYNSELVLKNGTKRVADWDKTIAADGTVTGTGTITWTDASGKVLKEVKVTLGGTEEDTEATAGGETVDADAPEAADEGTEASAEASGTVAAGDDDEAEAEEETEEESEEESEDETEDASDAESADDDAEDDEAASA